MSSAVEKSLAVLEMPAGLPEGQQVSALAKALDQTVSGVHRQLRELERLGYVRQLRSHGEYALTIRLVALGLGFLGRSGMAAMAMPVRHAGSGVVLGCLSVAGPTVRLHPEKLDETAKILRAHAKELGVTADGSRFFAGLRDEVEAAEARDPMGVAR